MGLNGTNSDLVVAHMGSATTETMLEHIAVKLTTELAVSSVRQSL